MDSVMREGDRAEDDGDVAPLAPASVSRKPGRRVVRSEDLFGRDTEVEIAHAGVTYLLRITRQGKLILNK
jgi:hemin uptake protein HemP